MPFAASGALALGVWMRNQQWRRFFVGFGAVVAVGAGVQFLAPQALARADLSQAVGNHAHALMQAGELAAAQQKQAAALATDPTNPYLLVNAGQLAMRLGDPQRALTLCVRAIERHALLATAHACRGVGRAQLGDLAGAISDLRRAVVLDPAAVAARLNLAIVLGRSGATGEARALLQELARVAPDDPTVKAAVQAVGDTRHR